MFLMSLKLYQKKSRGIAFICSTHAVEGNVTDLEEMLSESWGTASLLDVESEWEPTRRSEDAASSTPQPSRRLFGCFQCFQGWGERTTKFESATGGTRRVTFGAHSKLYHSVELFGMHCSDFPCNSRVISNVSTLEQDSTKKLEQSYNGCRKKSSGVQLSCFNASLKISFIISFVSLSSTRIPLLLALPFLSLLIAIWISPSVITCISSLLPSSLFFSSSSALVSWFKVFWSFSSVYTFLSVYSLLSSVVSLLLQCFFFSQWAFYSPHLHL